MAFPHDGKKFEPGKSGNPSGRPRKMVADINKQLAEEGYVKVVNQDVQDALQTLINLPLSKIAEIANKNIFYQGEDGEIIFLEEGDAYPVFYRLLAKELMGKRGAEFMEKILDRAYGKANQSHKVGFGDSDLPPDMEINLIVKGSKSKLI